MVFNLLSQIFLTKAERDKRAAFKKEIVGFFKDWDIKGDYLDYNNSEYRINTYFGLFEDSCIAKKALVTKLKWWQVSALKAELKQEMQRRIVKVAKEMKQQ